MAKQDKKKKKKFRDIHGQSRFSKFMKEKAPNLFGDILDIAGDLVPGVDGVTNVIERMISNDPKDEMTPELRAEAIALYKLDFDNVDSARQMQMQIATSVYSTLLAKNFIYYLATFWSIATVSYIYVITFYEVENVRVADTILGFLLGTIVATIINFFFGSSKGSKDKTDKLLNELR